jgi:hypothetical protein
VRVRRGAAVHLDQGDRFVEQQLDWRPVDQVRCRNSQATWRPRLRASGETHGDRHWMLSSSARRRSRAAGVSRSSLTSAKQSTHASPVGDAETGFRRQVNRDGIRRDVPSHPAFSMLGFIAEWVSAGQEAIITRPHWSRWEICAGYFPRPLVPGVFFWVVTDTRVAPQTKKP